MKTLRGRLLIGYLGITIVMISLILVFNSRYFHKRDSINNATNNIEHLYTLFLKDTRIIADLFRDDTRRPELFIHDSTELLAQHHFLLQKLDESRNAIYKAHPIQSVGLLDEVSNIYRSISKYSETIEMILENVRYRGFKDFGIEGEMRGYIHKLETYPQLNQAEILSLRRHEKDYIIRNDTTYIEKLDKLTDKLLLDASKTNFDSPHDRDTVIYLLTSYRNTFQRMVQIDSLVGIGSSTGLKADLDQQIATIDDSFTKILSAVHQKKNVYLQRLRLEYALFFLLLITIIIFNSYFLSHTTTKPLAILIKNVNEYVSSNFTVNKKVDFKNIPQEVQELVSSFNNMVDQLEKRELARLNAESNIVEAEIKYREMAELLPVGIFETDDKGYFQFVNRAWVKSLGFSKKESKLKLNFSQVITKQDFQRLFNGYKTNHVECNAIRKNGSTFSAVLITNEVVKNHKRKGIRGILIDNTERKKIVDALKSEKLKAQQSDKLKTAFLANMSHEIRTPMNAIIGFSNLLKIDLNTSERQKEYIETIQKSGEHLLNLIDDIIDIAKIESGGLSISTTGCNPHIILNEVASMFSSKLNMLNKSEVKIQVSNHLPKDVLILSDSTRVKQILVNLMSNALKFTHKGYVEIGASIEDYERIKFYVKDTGIGIEPKNIKVIFEAFRQANDEIAPNYGGNGLGLPISKNLANLLNGDIWVESEIGKGSIFYFTIPYDPVFEVKKVENVQPSLNDKNGLIQEASNNTILIAEDDNSNYYYLREYLSRFNLRILRAENGLQAIDMCKKNDIDLVFMDIQMPLKNGYEATKAIKAIKPNQIIIAQTAYVLAGERERCLNAGFNEYLAKPLSFTAIDEVLNQYLLKKKGVIRKVNLNLV
ncbi:MAG: ATP-binding protein [Bacteroidales bacterium]